MSRRSDSDEAQAASRPRADRVKHTLLLGSATPSAADGAGAEDEHGLAPAPPSSRSLGPRGTMVLDESSAAEIRAIARGGLALHQPRAEGQQPALAAPPTPQHGTPQQSSVAPPPGLSEAPTEEPLSRARRCDNCGSHYSTAAQFCPFDGEPLREAPEWDPRLDPLVGSTVDGRYHVEAVLASGGMGTVYRVRHVLLGSVLAMKVLRRDLASDEEVAGRLVAEAKATAAIGHPNIAAVSDYGELSVTELADRPALTLPYFVMEYVHGDTLGTVIRRDGPLPLKRVVDLMCQVAGALHAAHKAGIVHRDLKPDNINLVRDERGVETVKVLDFGVAKVMGASKLTRRGMVFGTPYYMSPEQAQGAAVDGRSDVYALGIILYECLTGTVPFSADTYMGVVTKHLFAQPPPLPQPTGLHGSSIEAVILRCLQKERDQRYRGMLELAADLERAARGVSLSASLSSPSFKLRQDGGPGSAARTELPVAGGSWRWLWLVLPLLLLLAALIAGWLWRTAGSASQRASPATVESGQVAATAAVRGAAADRSTESEQPASKSPRAPAAAGSVASPAAAASATAGAGAMTGPRPVARPPRGPGGPRSQSGDVIDPWDGSR